MPLPAAAIAGIVAAGTTIFNAISAGNMRRYNSPENQIKRLKEAGIHPNAIYSLGDLGAQQVNAQANTDSFGGIVQGIEESRGGKRDRTPVTIGGSPSELIYLPNGNLAQIPNPNYRRTDLATAERFAAMGVDVASARLSDAQTDESKARAENIREDSANKREERKLIAERITSEQLNQELTKLNMDEKEVQIARQRLELKGVLSDNERKEYEADMARIQAQWEEAVIVQGLKESDTRVRKMEEDMLLTASAIALNTKRGEVLKNDALLQELEQTVYKAENRLKIQEHILRDEPWTIENAPAKVIHTVTQGLRNLGYIVHSK